MNWVTVIWSMSAAVSLTLGAIHIAVWLQDRKAWANLLFAVMAVSVAAFAGVDLSMMRAETAAQFAELHVWVHVPLFVTIASLLGFILFYFRSGRVWLAWTVIGLRVAVLVINFTIEPTVNYRAITGLRPFQFLGETVSVPEAVPSPWSRLGEGSALLVLIFVVDASISLWRRGNANERRRAMVVGGSVGLFIAITVVNAFRVHTGAVHGPYLVSLLFLLIVVAMGYELSRDVVRAARMADELRENAASMDLAASAANLVHWRWDIPHDVIWFSAERQRIFDFPDGAAINLGRFLETVHPDDQEKIRQAVQHAIEGDGVYRMEFRMVLPGGAVRWISGRGKVEFNAGHKPLRMFGVSIDITERKAAEAEAGQQQAELAHVARVSTLGALAGTLAHELNQPLSAILNNAQAASRFLAGQTPDLAEIRGALEDIAQDTKRAGEVIRQIRALVKKDQPHFLSLDLNRIIDGVVRLLHGDSMIRKIGIVLELDPGLRLARGDSAQVQQVVLNLLLNAFDAMRDAPENGRTVHLRTRQLDAASIQVEVSDRGTGLSPERLANLFEPFQSSKREGLGLGLSISHSIIDAHRGRLWAENNPDRGATFYFTLPVQEPELKLSRGAEGEGNDGVQSKSVD